MKPFRHFHLLRLLETYEGSSLPMDRLIHDYFKSNKALGPKDRAFIAETAYNIVRYRSLLEHLCHKPTTWDKILEIYLSGNWTQQIQNPHIPKHIRLSFPADLYNIMHQSWDEKTDEICRICNESAPTTLRVNTLKINRNELLKRFNDPQTYIPSPTSANAIYLTKRLPLFSTPEFKEGLFEVQDEASQLVASLVQPKPGDHVLDFCSGSGGKTLAFAPTMQGKGQIYLHDIRPAILQEARRRLNRAGIQNVQLLLPDSPMLQKLQGKCDWVLVDAPCSGTGTLRRNPDMKWRFTSETLPRLVQEQRQIFAEALKYLKPNGRIVYATCSILKPENEEQIQYFMQQHNLKLHSEPLLTVPTPGGMDGFFGAILCKNQTS